MATQVQLFDQPMPVPAYLATSPVAKELQEQMEGGLAGSSINRISLRGGKFRFNVKGVEVGINKGDTLEVVIMMAHPAVSRLYYIKPYDQDDAGQRPDCYSRDGVRPEEDSPAKQNSICATCPQNALNSSKTGKGKACAYSKRVLVLHPNTLAKGPVFALDVKSMGMFGEDDPNQRLFNMKGYIEALRANGLIIPAVVTRLSFDDQESVPKLFFTPVRTLTAEEFAIIEQRVKDPEVIAMLQDIDNKTEEGKPVGQIAAPAQPAAPATPAPPVATAPAAPAPAPAAPAPEAAGQHTPAPPRRGRGRPPANVAAPAAAPAQPTAAPPNGGGQGGFDFAGAPATPAAPTATPAPQAAVAAAGGFSIDLEDLDL